MAFDYLKRKKILLVDDEPELLNMVTSILENEGYTNIKTASTASEAIDACKNFKPELLPDGNGFDLLRELKRISDFPVLFLTARGEDEDKWTGFGRGADDYMVKPFLPKELTFRIMAILRRSYKNDAPLVILAESEIDFDRAEVRKAGDVLPLTAKEYEILSSLYRNAGKIVTIDTLCEAAWGDNPYGYENSLMAHIRRIREKIEADPSHPVSLVTIKGLGYKLILEE